MSFRVARIPSLQCLILPRTALNSSPQTAWAKSYATRSSTADLLAQTLDTKRQTKRDSVGPFALGIPPSAQSGKTVKRWSELSAGGKGQHSYTLSKHAY